MIGARVGVLSLEMLRSRRTSVILLVAACAARPDGPSSAAPVEAPPPVATAPRRSAPPPEPAGWEPLIPYRGADLPAPAGSTVAALREAGDAAFAAGVVDVAARWYFEANAREPSPELAQRLAEARAEAGLDEAAGPLGPLPREVARPLRAAIRARDWDGAVEVAEAGLAAGPHPELYLWAGDAYWQQGRQREARRMWSRARVLMRAAGGKAKLSLPEELPFTDVAWSRGGLAALRGRSGSRWLELRDDRSWRRWSRRMIPGAPPAGLAWVGDDAIALAAGSRIEVFDAASNAVVAAAVTPSKIVGVVAAEAAPVLAVAHDTGEVTVWGVDLDGPPGAALQQRQRLTERGGGPVIAIDPAGKTVAVARQNKPLVMLDVAGGGAPPIAGPGARIGALRFLDVGELLVAERLGSLTRIALFDRAPVASGTLRWTGPPSEKPGTFDAVAMSRAGRVAATSTYAKGFYLCDGFEGTCGVTVKGTLRTGAFSPDGERLVAVSSTEVQVIEVATQEQVWQEETRPGPRIAGVAAGGAAVAVQEGNRLAVWDARSGAPVVPPGERRFLEFAGDGRSVVTFEPREGALSVHSLVGEPTRRFTGVQAAYQVSMSPDGRYLAAGLQQDVVVWDVATEAEVLRATHGLLHGLAVSAAGRVLIVDERGLHMRDVADPAVDRTLVTGEFVNLSLGPDGTLALLCGEGQARVIDLQTGRPGRRVKAGCSGQFLGPTRVGYVDEMDFHEVDLRSGRVSTGGELPGFRLLPGSTSAAVLVPGGVRTANVLVYATDGTRLATIHPLPGFEWVAQSAAGAVDGSPGAILGIDTRVDGAGVSQHVAGALAWDGAQVRGLLPRALAGEQVAAPSPP